MTDLALRGLFSLKKKLLTKKGGKSMVEVIQDEEKIEETYAEEKKRSNG